MTKYIWPVLHEGGMLLLTTGSLSLLLAFHWQAQSGAAWRLRGTGWLRSCGCISYEIYLTHMFIVLPAVRLYTSYGFGLWWAVILYPPVIALCWLLGWLVARSFSNPADRWLLSKFKSQKKLRSAMLPS
jgi:peptidoglycan/LPS O-acetylase OafA/YrhL